MKFVKEYLSKKDKPKRKATVDGNGNEEGKTDEDGQEVREELQACLRITSYFVTSICQAFYCRSRVLLDVSVRPVPQDSVIFAIKTDRMELCTFFETRRLRSLAVGSSASLVPRISSRKERCPARADWCGGLGRNV
jgi:hypothetical protein